MQRFPSCTLVYTSPSSTTVPSYGKMWFSTLSTTFNSCYTSRRRRLAPSLPAPVPSSPYFTISDFALGRARGQLSELLLRLALELQAVVVSADYRLAPETRLPAAIEDGYLSLKWLQAQAVCEEPDTWLTDVADFGRVFISGDSAGGNIAHNLAIRLGAPELSPVQLRGYVLLAPFFGGTIRTKSEAKGPKEAFLNLELIDRLWGLSIPTGDTTDHPFVNPFGPQSCNLELMDFDPILVAVGGSDLLKDGAEGYARRLKCWVKKMKYVEFEGKQLGFFTTDPNSEAANGLMQIIKHFVAENSS